MLKKFVFLLILVFSLILFLGCVSNQEFNLSLQVVNSSGIPLPDASVVLMPSNVNQITSVLSTDAQGRAFITLLPGSYNVTVSKEGFKTIVREFDLQENSSLKFVLQPI